MKIEVGKKYWARDKKRWGEVVKDRNDMDGNCYKSYNFIVVYSDGSLETAREDGKTRESVTDYDLVEEYAEPVKKSIDGWIGYEHEIDLEWRVNYGQIMAMPSGDWKKFIYGKRTFEQLPEPKE